VCFFLREITDKALRRGTDETAGLFRCRSKSRFEHMYDDRMGELRRYEESSGRRLDRVTPSQWYELTVAVMERIDRISALPASPDRSAVLRELRPLLERLARG
jgi:hypothetical protein